MTGGKTERSGKLLCVLSITSPEHPCMCLTRILLPVSFESLEIHPCEQPGDAGVGGRARVEQGGQMWRNRAIVLVREAVKIKNAL